MAHCTFFKKMIMNEAGRLPIAWIKNKQNIVLLFSNNYISVQAILYQQPLEE
jgi:hypothetical protein